MIDITSLIAFSVMAVLMSAFLVMAIRLFIQKRQLTAILIQTINDKNFVTKKLGEVFDEKEALLLEQDNGFIRFLSESRESAFNYIEQVQAALKEYDETIQSILEWNDTYGSVLGESPYSEAFEQIALAHKKLKDLLPEQTETPNN